jgi:ELWxxDGT repeat protein
MADKDNRLNGASRLSFPINRNNKLGKSDLDDLFRFNLSTSSANSSLSLGVSGIKKGANFDVEVYKFQLPDDQVLKNIGKTEFRKIRGGARNSNLQLVGVSRLGGNKSETINNDALADGSYVIRVLRKQGDSKYKLTASATEIPAPLPPTPPIIIGPEPQQPSPSELRNSITTAPDTTIPNGAITGSVSDADTQDYYKVTPTTSGDYLFDLSGASADANLEVISSDQTTALKRSLNAGNDKAIVPLTAGSTYYLRVFQASTGNNTGYSLSATQLQDKYSGKYDVASVGSGLGSATSLTVTNTAQSLTNYVVDQGVNSPEDLFTFNVTTDQGFVTLELTNMPIGNLDLQLFKSGETPEQGLTLNRSRNTDGSYPSELIAGRVEQGQYYVRVLPGGSTEGSTYDLSLKITDKTGLPAISRDIKFGADDSRPRNITAVGSLAYFSATDDDGTALYRTDGTLDGTKKIRSFSSLKEFAAVGTGASSRLYFVADDGSTGEELWTTDGSSATKVIDLFAGTGGSAPDQLAVAGNTLYFVASPGATSPSLYRVTGTTVTLIARNDITLTNPDGSASAAPVINSFANLTGIGETLYFAGNSGTGVELFSITNSEATPTLTELKAGAGSSTPGDFILVAGKLFATAAVSGSTRQLIRIDALGATPSYAIVRSSVSNGLSFNPTQKLQYTVTDSGALYFTANGDNEGSELFKLNNPAAVASGGFLDTGAVIKDIVSGLNGPNPTNLVHIGETVYFFANDNTSVVDGSGNTTVVGSGKELWSTNGTAVGTNIVKNIQGGTLSGIGDKAEMVVFGGKLYFTASDGSKGTEIWESNGLLDGTVIKEINEIPAQGSDPTQLTVVGTNLFFSATDGLNGEELWSI